MKIRILNAAFLILAAVLMAGCSSSGSTTPSKKFVDDRPLNERMFHSHSDLVTLTPESLVSENAAMIISSGGVINERNGRFDKGQVTFSQIGEFGLAIGSKGEALKETGNSAILVKPGKWQISTITAGGAANGIRINGKGSKLFEALGDFVEVKAGDVVYIGEMAAHIQPASFGTPQKIKGISQKDKFSSAQNWMKANYPSLAGKLEKRLIKCTICELQARAKQNAS